MLGTTCVKHRAASFMRHSRAVVARMNTEYPLLLNMVDSRNTASITYLRRLGFCVDSNNPVHPPSGVPFYIFTRHDVSKHSD